jgi:hypothetical protein
MRFGTQTRAFIDSTASTSAASLTPPVTTPLTISSIATATATPVTIAATTTPPSFNTTPLPGYAPDQLIFIGGTSSAPPAVVPARTTPPVISAISSGTPTTGSATITWTTDEAANSQVTYGIATSYSATSSSATLTTSHSVTLTGLTPANFYHFQIRSVDGQGNVATSSDQTVTTAADVGTLFQRAYNVLIVPASATYYSFPARVRPNEPQRTQLIVRNLGTTTLELGYVSGQNNSFFNGASSYPLQLNAGQQYAENGASTSMMFLRPHTSGQGGRYSVYVEFNGASQSGVATTSNIAPVPVGIPVLNVLSYTTSTAQPIGLSKDRTTVYGANGTTLYQSTNDGASWTSVATFPDNVVGLTETDDGEAICLTQGGAGVPGKLYKSTGWSTSHTAATWGLVLTSASNAYFRNYWDGGSYDSFGSNSINGTGKYGVITEYGTALNSGTDETYGHHHPDHLKDAVAKMTAKPTASASPQKRTQKTKTNVIKIQ